MFYSPLRYPGGKSSLYKFMTGLFYENDLIGIEYAEPYAGGAGLALRLLAEAYVSRIHINDLDRSVYAFWYEIIRDPDQFCSWLECVQLTIQNWYYFRDVQRNSESVDLNLLAKSFFFLNRTNVSGVIKGGVIGGYAQNGKYRMDARFNRTDLINRIRRISLLKDKINVTNIDGLDLINQLSNERADIFIYLDPPYVKKGSELYMNYYKKKDHESLASKIRTLNSNWVVSYDNNDFIIRLYNEEHKIDYQISQSTSNRIGSEILVFSKGLSYKRSISSLSNANQIFSPDSISI